MANVLLLRRNPEELTTVEKMVLQVQYGADVEFIRTDPADYRAHLADCERLKPVAVLLPLEKPIPAAAMEKGFAHVVVSPGGKLMQLEPLVPSFKIILEPTVPQEA